MADYQGSQAFASISRGTETVNRNTGSLSYSKTLIDLIGVKKTVSLRVAVRYSHGVSASFGLPQNWSFDIPFLSPNKTLTTSGQTYAIDFNWSDQAGWSSGLRYVNNHGIKLTFEGSPVPLPSGQPGHYEWSYRTSDGSVSYFDGVGKLLEFDDLHGNYIYYTYFDSIATPSTALLESITDSWGQVVQFEYQGLNEIVIQSPDGSTSTLTFDETGMIRIKDALAYSTLFIYAPFGSGRVLDTIAYPTGLLARFTYQQIAYLDGTGQTHDFPAVQNHYHLFNSEILGRTEYIFGSKSGSATFTGLEGGYRMGSARDALMDSNNLNYQYDTLVANYDPDGLLLSATRIFFNFLHLPTQEHHHTIVDGQLVPTYQAMHTYLLDTDRHARSTNYSLPATTEQFHLDANGTRQPLRRSTATYDDYGSPVTTTDEMWENGTYETLRSHQCTYTTASWGGQMLATECFQDQAINQQRLLTYGLSTDQKNVQSITTQFMGAKDTTWKPWKQKDMTWDAEGRLESEVVISTSPSGGTSSKYTLSYSFDSTNGAITTTTTDCQGNSYKTTHSTLLFQGPVIEKTLPLGETEHLNYDELGRLVKHTDPMGNVTTSTYALGPLENSVTTTNAMGYATTRTYSSRGEIVQISDISTTDSSKRTLCSMTYDALSRRVSKTNELGLTTTHEYDALNRVKKTSDYLDNTTLVTYDDSSLTQQSYINGQLRSVTTKDANGRVVQTVNYADAGDTSIDYCLVHNTTFSGLSLVTSVATLHQSLTDASQKLLFKSDRTYDPEFAVTTESCQAVRSDMVSYDTVERNYQYDVFGHLLHYSKDVTYDDGRNFSWQSPRSSYDAVGHLIKQENQLGQMEQYTYNGNGFMTSMTRYDGSNINYERDALGRLTKVTNQTQSLSKTYLTNSRISTVKDEQSGNQVAYSYAKDGCLLGITHADGTQQKWTLDNTSRVTNATDALGSEQTTSYAQNGLVSSRAMGSETLTYTYGVVNHINNRLVGDSFASHTRSLEYDGYNRLTGSTVSNQDGQIILNSKYQYNSLNKIVGMELTSQVYPETEDLNYIRTYEYDGLGQLLMDATTFKSGKIRSISYQFDGNSNIIKAVTDGVSEEMAYNAIDQRTDNGFTWDLNGRLLTDDKQRKYTYANDRLVAVQTVTGDVGFSYAPNGALSTKEIDESRNQYYYDMGSVNAIIPNTTGNTSQVSYLQEPGRRIAAFSDDTIQEQFVQSGGSTSMIIRADNTITPAEYGAYGTSSSDATAPSFGYKQELTDNTSGLVYLRSRYYQPDTRTFISMDVAAKENKYTYCQGDPTNNTDGTGKSRMLGMAIGFAVGSVVTVGAGVATGGLGAVVFGPEVLEASIGAGAVAGAAGNFSGDLTASIINKQHFSVKEGIEDLVSGGLGGAAGAGAGQFVGSRAMAAALAESMSQRAIAITGSVTSGVAGGAVGAFAGSGSMAVMTGQPIFSENTAMSTLTGAVAGAGGGFLSSGAYLGVLSSNVIPVPLTEAEMHLIVPAVQPDNVHLQRALYVMAPQDEAMSTYHAFQIDGLEPNDALRLRPGFRDADDMELCDTIAAHGLGRSVFASVRYAPGEVGEEGIQPRPNYVRPVKGRLFAHHMAENLEFANSERIKFLSCFGAYSNAQDMANALETDVWASYEEIDRYSATTRWRMFSPPNNVLVEMT